MRNQTDEWPSIDKKRMPIKNNWDTKTFHFIVPFVDLPGDHNDVEHEDRNIRNDFHEKKFHPDHVDLDVKRVLPQIRRREGVGLKRT